MKGQYIQFFTKSKNVNSPWLNEVNGSDGKHFLDGRLSLDNCYKKAVELTREKGYHGFRICKMVSSKGESWGKYITDYNIVHPK